MQFQLKANKSANIADKTIVKIIPNNKKQFKSKDKFKSQQFDANRMKFIIKIIILIIKNWNR